MPALLNHYDLDYADYRELVTLDGIVKSHPFVFRLQERASESFNADGDLIAPKFISSPSDSPSTPTTTPITHPSETSISASMLEHVDMWKSGVCHHERPWISTTFSLPYILYEGQRRAALFYKVPTIPWEPANAEVIIIDIRPSRMKESPRFLALNALRKYAKQEGQLAADSYKRACDFSGPAQEVLTHRCIPHTAIVARWPYATFEDVALPLYHTCQNGCNPVFSRDDKWRFFQYAEHCTSRRRRPVCREDVLDRILLQFMHCLELQHVKWSDGQDVEEAVATVVSSVMYFVLPKRSTGSRDLSDLCVEVRRRLAMIQLRKTYSSLDTDILGYASSLRNLFTA